VFRASPQLFSETFIILRIERNTIKNVHWSLYKLTVIFVRYIET